LAVAVFSKAARPALEPLFFLSGGPGDAAIDLTVRLFPDVFSAFLNLRDLIVIDQRGTGRSEPSLNCPERNLFACRVRLARQGIDLSAYTTTENAADINDVRLALGYRQVDLLGGSYGTLLAQAVMRDYPETVRSAILDSPAPLQALVQLELIRHFEPALQVLFDACESDAACNRAYPRLRETFYDVVNRLNAAPLRVRVPGHSEGPAREFSLTGDRFGFLIWQSLYYSEAIPHLPKIICDTAAGNRDRLARLIEKQRTPDERSEGMQQSVECAETAPFMEPDDLHDAARMVSPALRSVALQQFGDIFERCRVWNVRPADARAKAPLRSSIPVLLLVGAFDPATPPHSARWTAETLTRHYLFVFPDSGHGVFRTSDCARAVIAAFLTDTGRPPRLPCVEQLAGPRFVQTASSAIPVAARIGPHGRA
jgi:pimeloyl-ACP methyl ester carboxylesterase